MIGLERSAVGTVAERTTRFSLLVHLPREEGYRHKETLRNGPALGGYGAITMKNALANTMSALPEQLARSLTWDRGKEMSEHVKFKVETGIPVFFADPSERYQTAVASPEAASTIRGLPAFCATAERFTGVDQTAEARAGDDPLNTIAEATTNITTTANRARTDTNLVRDIIHPHPHPHRHLHLHWDGTSVSLT